MPSACDIQVAWPTTKGPVRPPATVDVRQTEFRHEMAVLTYYAEPHAVQRYKEGTPLHIRWGKLPNTVADYYGTVLYIRPHVENEKHSVRVVCIGTSYPLKDVTPEVHINQSVEQVVSRIAAHARLDLVRDPASMKWPMLVRTAKETGWEYLLRLAHRQGYTLFVNQAMMHFYDPVKMLLANKESWPILQYHYGRGNDFRGDIVSFTPVLGDQGVPGYEQRSYRMLSVDPVSGGVIGATDHGVIKSLAAAKAAPKFGGFLAGHPAHSIAEAQAYVQGMRADQRWVHKATARIYGNAKIRQGMGVYLSGVSAESDGLWYVSEALHLISAEKHPQQYRYFTDLTLLRDSREISAVTQVPRRALRNRSTHTPTPVLSKGQWVSRHQTERVNAA